jgi:uncharacterized membrane protein YjjB (DUF3815 family)
VALVSAVVARDTVPVLLFSAVLGHVTNAVTVAADQLAFILAIGLAMTIFATVEALPISSTCTTLAWVRTVGFIVSGEVSGRARASVWSQITHPG